MKKALANIVCGNKKFEIGKVYENKDVIGLDQRDFEDVSKKEVKDEAPQSLTNETFKVAKKKAEK